MKVYLVHGVHEENTFLALFLSKENAEKYISEKPVSEADYDGFEYYSYYIEEIEAKDS